MYYFSIFYLNIAFKDKKLYQVMLDFPPTSSSRAPDSDLQNEAVPQMVSTCFLKPLLWPTPHSAGLWQCFSTALGLPGASAPLIYFSVLRNNALVVSSA